MYISLHILRSDFFWCILGRRLSKRLGSKVLCLPLFSWPGERVCERGYFPVTSDIPTRTTCSCVALVSCPSCQMSTCDAFTVSVS